MGCDLLLYRGSALIVIGWVLLVVGIIGKVKNSSNSEGDSEVSVDEICK